MIYLLGLVVSSLLFSDPAEAGKRAPLDKPNFVILFADDMGYGDLASYGHPIQERGPIDDIMVAGGIRFTQGYVPDTVCSPSRAALLTGRYPARSGVYSSDGSKRVFLPWSRTGLPLSEITVAEALKEIGYTTGMVGKWHLGMNNATRDDGTYLPMKQGFDFVGHFIPFTMSMTCDSTGRIMDFPDTENCILMKSDGEVVAQPYNSTYLTQTFVNDALAFIDNNSADPFLLYFPFAHPHAAMFASPRFAGKSRRGEYGDNMNELNWAAGEIIRALEENGIAENTLVFFISDHGPHREYCAFGGDASIFKGYKSNTWEGGVRVPFVAYWPGTITPRTSDALVSTLDIIETIVDLAGGSLPNDRPYDGEIITDVLLDDTPSPHDVLYFYCEDRLMAVRSGPYKVHFFTNRVRTEEFLAEQCGEGGIPLRHYFDCENCYSDCVTAHDPPLIFNVETDPIEAYALNVSVDPALDAFMVGLLEKVQVHEAGLVAADPIVNIYDTSHDIVPCCNPDDECRCNFGAVTGPYSDYQRKPVHGGSQTMKITHTFHFFVICLALLVM